jgi:hypothetical protein
MKWSVSASRIFAQCPRKWYYGAVFASSRAESPRRKEAFVLKHLENIHAWRGRLVDQVISRLIVPKMNRHEKLDRAEVFAYADRLEEAQLAFARAKLYRKANEDGEAANKDDFCALFELEYGDRLDEKAVRKAADEVRTSLTNFLDSRLFRTLAKDGEYLIPQRPLQFEFAGTNVSCTPDLIAFFRNKTPAIVDWKVEYPWHREHWLQLGIYSVALSRTNPHKDFPREWLETLRDPTEIGLVEFQLLRNQELYYSVTEDDVVDLEDYVYSSSSRMMRMVDGKDVDLEVLVDSLPTTRSPHTCMMCNFRLDCWKGGAR